MLVRICMARFIAVIARSFLPTAARVMTSCVIFFGSDALLLARWSVLCSLSYRWPWTTFWPNDVSREGTCISKYDLSGFDTILEESDMCEVTRHRFKRLLVNAVDFHG